MRYEADLERMEGRWIGYVRDLPGCFASAESRVTCVAALPEAVREDREWSGLPMDAAVEVAVGESHLGWLLDEDYEVNAFFAADRPPLSAEDAERGLRLLDLARRDLLATVAPLSPEERQREVEDGWSVERILGHVGGAEWWYLDRLDLAPPRDAAPDDALDRLAFSRRHLVAALLRLAGSDLVTEPRMELWSPRKLLRRALWHERDHTVHIQRFAAALRRS
ncbi:MAG TPA: DinB family protein [Thermomicrobiales bacterium]|nr:DinB family protein [Thermomicrobiales bacterium]